MSFAALQSQKTGNLERRAHPRIDTVVTSLTFSAPISLLKQNDFALKGIAYTPRSNPSEVPELSGNAAPLGLMLLLGCAMLLNERRVRQF